MHELFGAITKKEVTKSGFDDFVTSQDLTIPTPFLYMSSHPSYAQYNTLRTCIRFLISSPDKRPTSYTPAGVTPNTHIS
jgi:hypothetical protein